MRFFSILVSWICIALVGCSLSPPASIDHPISSSRKTSLKGRTLTCISDSGSLNKIEVIFDRETVNLIARQQKNNVLGLRILNPDEAMAGVKVNYEQFEIAFSNGANSESGILQVRLRGPDGRLSGLGNSTGSEGLKIANGTDLHCTVEPTPED